MKSETPLFPVTVVGSWPRSPQLLRAMRQKHSGRIAGSEFDRVADRAVVDSLRAQESAGVDIVTDGEQRRDNFYSFVAEKLSGVRLMTLADVLEVVEDKAGFEKILQTLDVPAYAMKTAACVGKVERRRPLAVDDYRFLKENTMRPIKVTLPGPYLLTRAMWVKEIAPEEYASKEELGVDVVRALSEEVHALRDAGVDFIQFDEPVLTELVFATRETRTFMCASLAARNDPGEELEFAVSLINRVVAGVEGVRLGLHICRGNWSQNEAVLLEGSYHPLVPYLKRMNVQQLVLEFATPRAGALSPLAEALEGRELGLGVVNPRTSEVEPPERIVARAEEALRYVEPEKLFLNPDCGFGTFAQRPINTPEIATQKLGAMSEAAARLRSGHA